MIKQIRADAKVDRWTELAKRTYRTATPTKLQRNAVKAGAMAGLYGADPFTLASIIKAGTRRG